MRLKTTAQATLEKLKALADPEVRKGMARFAVPTENALGISTPAIKKLARQIGKNHALAQALSKTGIHEARTLAALVDDPNLVSEAQMERWAKDFDSWDVCDCCCWHLFDRTPYSFSKAAEWTRRHEEFVKRAGFALMASLAVHDKAAKDARFLKFFPAIKRESAQFRQEGGELGASANWQAQPRAEPSGRQDSE